MTEDTAEVDAHVDACRIVDALRRGYEQQDAAGMGELYGDGATWELHIGDAHVLLHGRPAIVERYTGDLQLPPVLHRWDVRPAPWGAVVEAEAEQGHGDDRVRFRWVHLLTVEQGRITHDVIYCSGAVPDTAPA